MGHFDMRGRALLPRGRRGKRTRKALPWLGWQQLIRICLPDLRPTVRQDLLQNLCQVANQMEAVDHLLGLWCAQGGGFGKILAAISAHEFDFWVRL